MSRPDLTGSLLSRDWALLERLKADFWSERKRTMTPEEALHIGDELRETARRIHPDWPSEEERREDLATHIRVSAGLRLVR